MKKNNTFYITLPDGKEILTTQESYDLIKELSAKLSEKTSECNKLQTELDIIKPVLETKDLTPAVSNHCKGCIYVVRSRWNGEILGCCKNIVCNDFYPKED